MTSGCCLGQHIEQEQRILSDGASQMAKCKGESTLTNTEQETEEGNGEQDAELCTKGQDLPYSWTSLVAQAVKNLPAM